MRNGFVGHISKNSLEALEVISDLTPLIESMRAVGYLVEASIADLIDSGISAQADLTEAG
jgi:hypothetical protein